MDIISYKMGQNSIEPDKPDQTKTADPSTQTQVIRPDAGYELASVTVNAVTSSIDNNIVASNIKKNVSILGVNGTLDNNAYEVETVQEMNAITTMQDGDLCVVKPAEPSPISYNYNGLTINDTLLNNIWSVIEGKTTNDLDYGSWNSDYVYHRADYLYVIVTKSTYGSVKYIYFEFAKNIDNLGSRDSNGTVPIYYQNKTDIIRFEYNTSNNDIKTSGEVNTYTRAPYSGWYYKIIYTIDNISAYKKESATSFSVVDKSIVKDFDYSLFIPTHSIYQYGSNTWTDITEEILETSKSVTPSTSAQTITASNDYKGIKQVNLSAVTSSIDANIQAENIKKDVTILGVTGNYEDSGVPELDTKYIPIYDSSCIGGEKTTSLTTSVNSLKDNIVYAVICARKTITLSDNTWTLLKTEKCESGTTIQTTYVYYKIPSQNSTVSLTVNQAQKAQMLLSLFAMNYSETPATTITSEELAPNSNTITINNIDLIEGDLLILSAVSADTQFLTDTFTLSCEAIKYATLDGEQRLTIFRINEETTDLTITFDNLKQDTISYIKLRPKTGIEDLETYDEAVQEYGKEINHTGAYKVETTTEMNAITDMREGDVCIVKPENLTFTRLNNKATEILNGDYSNGYFIFSFTYQEEYIMADELLNTSAYKIYPRENFSYNSTLDTFTLNIRTNKNVIWQLPIINELPTFKGLEGYPIHTGVNTYSIQQTASGGIIQINTLTYNSNDANYTLRINDNYSITNNIILISNTKNSWDCNEYDNTTSTRTMSPKLYYAPKPTNYSVYQYTNNTWADITDTILAPSQTVTPSNTEQTITAPNSYKGLSEVVVEAIPA